MKYLDFEPFSNSAFSVFDLVLGFLATERHNDDKTIFRPIPML